MLERLPGYGRIAPTLYELAGYYCDLQVHKHVREEERVPRLEAWFGLYKEKLPPMSWYEFAACAGSTLGIFCIVSQSMNKKCSDDLVHRLKEAYFPWVQGLHILLDYLIDQAEDRTGKDLNFCFYYPTEEIMAARLVFFFRQAHEGVSRLPLARFHRMINCGLLAMYLADKKVYRQRGVRKIAREMIRVGGGSALFFYIVCWTYRRMKASSLGSMPAEISRQKGSVSS
jgi:tetraprenyl-beta-curcumene synthase